LSGDLGPLAMRTDEQLLEELPSVLHPGVGSQEIARGCEIIESLMRRKKAWLVQNGKWEDAK